MQNDSNCRTFILVYIDDSFIRGEQLDTKKKVNDLFLRNFKMDVCIEEFTLWDLTFPMSLHFELIVFGLGDDEQIKISSY